MTAPIRVGIQYETFDPVDRQRAIWLAAEEAGFDQLWNSDHLIRTPSSGDPTGPILESWTMLAAMAETTERIRIGALVSGNLYRHPALLAKMAVTVDHLSGGRLVVGLGTAWDGSEFSALGMPFADTTGERGRRLVEACGVLTALWTQDRATFEGRYYRVVDAVAEPKPVQRPHPPLVLGGRGHRITLGAVARYAEGWNTSGSKGFDVDREASLALDERCRELGRDPSTVRRSVILEWPNRREGMAFAERYAAIGFTEFVFPIDRMDGDRLELVGTLAREGLEPLRSLGS